MSIEIAAPASTVCRPALEARRYLDMEAAGLKARCESGNEGRK
jgi:hypothetical protein